MIVGRSRDSGVSHVHDSGGGHMTVEWSHDSGGRSRDSGGGHMTVEWSHDSGVGHVTAGVVT